MDLLDVCLPTGAILVSASDTHMHVRNSHPKNKKLSPMLIMHKTMNHFSTRIGEEGYKKR